MVPGGPGLGGQRNPLRRQAHRRFLLVADRNHANTASRTPPGAAAKATCWSNLAEVLPQVRPEHGHLRLFGRRLVGGGHRQRRPHQGPRQARDLQQGLSPATPRGHRAGSRYVPVVEVWFDGGCVIEVGDVIKQYAPDAVIFGGPYATIRWVGNETGLSALSLVEHAAAARTLATGLAPADHGSPDGNAWAPWRPTRRCTTTTGSGPRREEPRKSLDRTDERLLQVGRPRAA